MNYDEIKAAMEDMQRLIDQKATRKELRAGYATLRKEAYPALIEMLKQMTALKKSAREAIEATPTKAQ